MFELAHRDWSDRVIDLVELPREVLPPVRDPGTVIGEVTTKAAAETGFRQGTPVVVGGADTQLALVGIGRTQPHKFTVIGGSFWQAHGDLRPGVDRPDAASGRCATRCPGSG